MTEQGLDGGELLHRSINPEDVIYTEGAWSLSTTAFNDRNKKPSVDRVAIRPDAHQTKRGPDCGVVALLTHEVRVEALVPLPPDTPASDTSNYVVDVFARPIEKDNPPGEPENRSHAQIESAPEPTGSRFRKLKEALCRLAERRGFVVAPVRKDATD